MPGVPADAQGRVSGMPQPSWRSHRNNPYAMDRMFAQVHHSAAGAIWRFRTELALLLAAVTGTAELAKAVTLCWAALILTTLAITVAVVPCTRRVVTRRAWCVLSRHRIQRACFETRMHTRSGRLPLVLRITPTQVGERALIWCRAGICAADFEAHVAEIAAACYARQARIEASQRWAQLVQLDIVRRDTLAPHLVITSRLADSRRKAAS
jgi:hypothetical protein